MIKSPFTFQLGVIGIVLASLALRLYRIDGFSGDYDEGVHFMVSWLMMEGYHLYADIASNQLPMLYAPTAWVFALGEPSLVLGRWVEIAFALLGVVAVAGVGRHLIGPWAGLAAAAFLSLEFNYFIDSRMGIGSVSAVAIGSVSVLCALNYTRRSQRFWLVVAGFVYAFSLFVKPLSLPLAVLLGWIIWQHRDFNLREFIIDGLYLSAGAVIVPVYCAIVYDGQEMFNRLVYCRLAEKVTQERRTVGFLLNMLSDYARNNPGLFALALWGGILAWWQRDKTFLFPLAWLGLSLGLLLAESPQQHHIVMLNPGLVLLAAYPLTSIGKNWGEARLQTGISVLLMGVWVVSMGLQWPAILDKRPNGLDTDKERWEAVAFLQDITTPEQYVVTDDFSIPFVAGRKALPQLASPAFGSIECGLMREEMFMQETDRAGTVVMFWSGRFQEKFLALRLWVESAYAQQRTFDAERIIYYDRRPPMISHPVHATFGEALTLEGYHRSAGQLIFYWRKTGPITDAYKITLRLRDTAGNVIVQVDRDLFAGEYPPHLWPVDVLLPETVPLWMLGELNVPPGDYTLVMGLYHADSLELLPISGSETPFIPLDILTSPPD